MPDSPLSYHDRLQVASMASAFVRSRDAQSGLFKELWWLTLGYSVDGRSPKRHPPHWKQVTTAMLYVTRYYHVHDAFRSELVDMQYLDVADLEVNLDSFLQPIVIAGDSNDRLASYPNFGVALSACILAEVCIHGRSHVSLRSAVEVLLHYLAMNGQHPGLSACWALFHYLPENIVPQHVRALADIHCAARMCSGLRLDGSCSTVADNLHFAFGHTAESHRRLLRCRDWLANSVEIASELLRRSLVVEGERPAGGTKSVPKSDVGAGGTEIGPKSDVPPT